MKGTKSCTVSGSMPKPPKRERERERERTTSNVKGSQET